MSQRRADKHTYVLHNVPLLVYHLCHSNRQRPL